MTTRNLVPRADGEGSLGTAAKQWGAMRAKNIYIDGVDVTEAVTSTADNAEAAASSATAASNVATALTDIYNEAIEEGTIVAPAIDPILTISGAASDAKVTGSRFTNIEDTVGIVPLIWESGGITINGGTDYESAANYRTQNRIPTTAGEVFYIFGIPSDCDLYIHEYKSDSSVAYIQVAGSYRSKYVYTTRTDVVEIRFRANRNTDPKGAAESISVLQLNRNIEDVLLGHRYNLSDPVDLNDIKNNGIYYKMFSNNDVDNMPSGLETNSSGLLIVYTSPTSTGSTRQIYYPNQGIVTYTRVYSENSWGGWIKNETGLAFKKILGIGDNIDELTGLGIWQINAGSIESIEGTFPTNWGKTNATLFNVNSNVAVVQFLCSGDNSDFPQLFVRRKTTSNWSIWRKVCPVKRNLPANTDVNTLYEEGTYTFTGANAVTFIGMPPSNLRNAGVLKVFSIYPAGWTTSYSGRIAQLIINSAGNLYFRYKNDPYDAEDSSVGWDDWHEVGDNFSFYVCRERSIVGNNPAKSGLPILYINGDLTGISHEQKVDVTWEFKGESGNGTLKLQGRGSLGFPKKNYTLKLDASYDFGLGSHNKFVLKGCYNDPSFSANLTGAKLWGGVASTRQNVPTQLLPENAPNYGCVDGYPVMVIINNEYAGLFDFNIPKDKWFVGMGGGESEALICSDQIKPSCRWKALVTDVQEEGTDWVIEETVGEVTSSDIITSLNQAIQSVIDAVANEDSDWETTVGQYVDIDSAIDYYILRCLIDDRDGAVNNQLMVTYDMTKWYLLPYDMDNSFGLTNQYYDTFPINKVGDNRFAVYALNNDLFNLIWTYSRAKLKTRYATLRANLMSYRKVYYTAIDIMGRIPAVALAKEHSMYPVARANSVFDVAHIINHYRINCEVCDEALDYGGTP